MTWENELSAIVKDERATIEETSPDVDLTAPTRTPLEAEAFVEQRAAVAAAPPGQRLAADADVQSVDEVFTFLDASQQAGRIAEIRGEREEITPVESVQENLRIFKGQIDEGLETNVQHLGTPEGSSQLKGLTAEIVRQLALDENFSGPRKEWFEAVKFRLKQEYGVKVGFINGSLNTVISNTIEFLSRGLAPSSPLHLERERLR